MTKNTLPQCPIFADAIDWSRYLYALLAFYSWYSKDCPQLKVKCKIISITISVPYTYEPIVKTKSPRSSDNINMLYISLIPEITITYPLYSLVIVLLGFVTKK